MRSLCTRALFALCLTVIAGCAAENDPVGVSALPTEEGLAPRSANPCCPDGCGATCAGGVACEDSCGQEGR